MANLGDAFKKAGVISDKELRRQKHEERVRRKELGYKGQIEEERRKDEQRKLEDAERRERNREIERARRESIERRERAARAVDLVRNHSTSVPRGRRAFHYVDGQAVFRVMIDDAGGRRLEAGEVALVRTEEGVGLLPREHVNSVREASAELLLFFNEKPA